MKSTTLRFKDIFSVFLTICIIFSTDIVAGFSSSSQYASINSEDLVMIFIVIAFINHAYENNFKIELIFPKLTAYLLIITIWLLFTVLLAHYRFEESVLASYLWFFKWTETVIFFILAQVILDRRSCRFILITIITSSILISFHAFYLNLHGVFRYRAFFGNPNTTAAFLILPTLISISMLFKNEDLLGLAGSIIFSLAILSTGSRSGILGLITGTFVLTVLYNKDIYLSHLVVGGAVASVVWSLSSRFIDAAVLRRFQNIWSIENGDIIIHSPPINNRIDLFYIGIDLFKDYPLTGYGWYASPSRVAFLDIHYTTLLVEVGIIGAILFFLLYIQILKDIMNIRTENSLVFRNAGFAWFCGLLVHSIGGNPILAPHILFIIFLYLIVIRNIE